MRIRKGHNDHTSGDYADEFIKSDLFSDQVSHDPEMNISMSVFQFGARQCGGTILEAKPRSRPMYLCCISNSVD